MSGCRSGSVQGPLVSYRRTGGLGRLDPLDRLVSESSISRKGTATPGSRPFTYIFLELGKYRSYFSERGFFGLISYLESDSLC
jgi:hypothetical protein